jgi:hypothetical protein
LSMLAKIFVYLIVFGVFSYTFFSLFLKRWKLILDINSSNCYFYLTFNKV